MQAQLLSNVLPLCELGEGPVWHQGKLWWVDILQKKVHFCVPSEPQQRGSYTLDQMVGAVTPCVQGGWLAALQDGIYRYDDSFTKENLLAMPADLTPKHRFNDGKCDPWGRFWVGTTTLDNAPQAACLYRMETGQTISTQRKGVTISNGLAWNPKGDRLYYIDTPSLQVLAFALDVDGNSHGDPDVVLRFDPADGYPDGMSMDALGNLWIAFWGGGCVRCYDSVTGTCLETLELPVPLVTSCCFGGADLATLYITTAWTGMEPAARKEKPLAGAVFVCEPGVKGQAVSLFQG
jgi:sugar lactone lactonase YvrE